MYEKWAEDNRSVAEQIRRAANRDALFHALIFSGNGGVITAAHYAAAALECTASDRPCGHCENCRKIQKGIHPDVSIVQDTEHTQIARDIIRQVCTDAFILPNEGRKKIYIFPDCTLLPDSAQNILLKVLEEGPAHAAFLFCAADAGELLQTIRSRCIEWKLRPEHTPRVYTAYTENFCRTLVGNHPGELTELMIAWERDKKFTREMLSDVLESSLEIVTSAMAMLYGFAPPDMGLDEYKQPSKYKKTELERQNRNNHAGNLSALLAKRLTKMQMAAMIEILQKYLRECAFHISVKQLCGVLAVELEAIRSWR